MSHSIHELRQHFESPPVWARPLTLIHSLERFLRHRSQKSECQNWMPQPDQLHDSLKAALTHIQSLGFGGIVTNVAYENYLHDEEQWELFKQAVAACQTLGLRVWIYDELGYPSGAAGGLVLQGHPHLEAEVLVQSVHRVPAGPVSIYPPTGWRRALSARACFEDETLDLSDAFDSTGLLSFSASAPCLVERYDIRAGFEGAHATQNVHVIRRYINVIEPEAVNRFYDITYQTYLDRLGPYASLIEAFFTDEPSFMAAYYPDLPDSLRANVPVQDIPIEPYDKLPQLPWRTSLPDDFREKWGYDLMPHIHSLFSGCEPLDFQVRHDFHQLASELYAKTFFSGLQSPLRQHSIPLSGHVLGEESIIQHVASEGSTIACLKEMDKPGIDILTSLPHRILETPRLLTCKYGSSAAHITGKYDVMSEASDWEERTLEQQPATLEQRRGALAVQLALGITTFASYYTWREFEVRDVSALMDFCARLHAVSRLGTHVAHAAVLYPIRTAWAHYLPTSEPITSAPQPYPLDSLDAWLFQIARTLLSAQLDFDFIDSESLVESKPSSHAFTVASESYPALIIPPSTALSPDDIQALHGLARAGVPIIAFLPLSTVGLGPIPRSSSACATTAADALTMLAAEHPDIVHVVNLNDQWLHIIEQSARRDVLLSGNTHSILLRQSKFSDGDAYILVNASDSPASLSIHPIAPGDWSVWNPTNGSSSPFISQLTLEPMSTMVLIREQHS